MSNPKLSPLLYYKSLTVDSVNVSYIEAGNTGDPLLLLLAAFPSSANEYRKLIPLLANDYNVIAPSYPAFGLTSAPANFVYSWSNLAAIISGLLVALNISCYATYLHGYGMDVGMRLALEHPGATKAIVTQNGNAYVEGFGHPFWDDIFALWNESDSAAARATVADTALTLAGVESIYATGTDPKDLELLDGHQIALDFFQNIDGERNQNQQLDLLYDYRNNVALYPQFQEYFRRTQVPLFALWAAHDPAFVPAGAEAYKKDLPHARVELIDGGHMVIESKLDEVATKVLEFLKDVGFKK